MLSSPFRIADLRRAMQKGEIPQMFKTADNLL